MNSSECGVKSDGHALDKEVKVEKDADDISDVETQRNLEDECLNRFARRIAKRSASHGFDSPDSEQNQPAGRKKAKVGELFQGGGSEETPRSPQDRTVSSYRKPLYGISHRISEKKANMDQHESGIRVSRNGILFPKLDSPIHVRFDAAASSRSSTSPVSPDSHLYPLFEKMFFILNSLNSSMSQLHSKVDLLSLEVTRIKKQIKPSEMAMEFQPPPEYQLTREELGQLMEQTSSAGAQTTLKLAENLMIKLIPLKIQAFDLPKGTFGEETECMADYTKRIIPIVVGAVVAGIILISVLVYVLMRERRSQGYEQL